MWDKDDHDDTTMNEEDFVVKFLFGIHRRVDVILISLEGAFNPNLIKICVGGLRIPHICENQIESYIHRVIQRALIF